MIAKSKQAASPEKLKKPLILTGIGLTFGWAFILALTNLQVTLSCTISPSNCSLGDSLATTICSIPIYIGSVLVPLGAVLYAQWPLIVKILMIIVAAPVLWYASLIVFSYLDIFIHGLAPF